MKRWNHIDKKKSGIVRRYYGSPAMPLMPDVLQRTSNAEKTVIDQMSKLYPEITAHGRISFRAAIEH
jgi:hypothetical protein